MKRGGSGSLRTSFSVSFFLLPPPRREAIRTIYRFCRVTDDLVDNDRSIDVNREALGRWRTRLGDALTGVDVTAADGGRVLSDLAKVTSAFDIDRTHYFDLIDGVGMDLDQKRYRTFDELERYCRLVASSVGMMCLPVFGAPGEEAAAYALRLGIALQFTNILRDVARDARTGRIYLPLEDLAAHSCTEQEILGVTDTGNVRRLIAFEVERAEALHSEAANLLPSGLARRLAPARVMGASYRRILQLIRQREYRIGGPEVKLSGARSALTAARYLIFPPNVDA